MATTLYLRNTTWDTNRYQLLTTQGSANQAFTTDTQTTTQVQWTYDTTGDAAIEWCTGGVNTAVTISNAVSFQLGGVESNMSANASFRIRLYKVSADRATWTEMGGGPFDDNSELEVTTATAYKTWTGTPTSNNSLAVGERLGVRVFIDDNTGTANQAAGYIATLWCNNTGNYYNSYLQTVENLDLEDKAPSPPTGALQFEGFAPTRQLTETISRTPELGLVQLLGFAPLLLTLAMPPAGRVELQSFAPSVGITQTVSPPTGEIQILGAPPTASIPQSPGYPGLFGYWVGRGAGAQQIATDIRTPDVGTVLLEGKPPALVQAFTQRPELGAIQLLGFEPSSTVQNNWTRPRTATATNGSWEVSDVSRAWDDDGTNLVGIETSGTSPGFAFDFVFTQVPENEARSLVIKGYYAGVVAHEVKLQQWNFNTSSWIDLTGDDSDIPTGGAEETYVHPLLGSTGNFWSAGEIRIRIVQADPGTPAHRLYLDQVALSTGITAHPVNGVIQLIGAAPSLIEHLRPSPTNGTVQLVGAGPALALQSVPPAGTIQFLGIAPSASQGVQLVPDVGTVLFWGAAPAVQLIAVPPAGTIQLVGANSALALQSVSQLGTIQFLGFGPTATVSLRLTPDTGKILLEGAAPSRVEAFALTPPNGTLQLLGFAPGRVEAWTLTPPNGTVQFLGPAPTLRTGIYLVPLVGQVQLDGQPPALREGISRVPPVGEIRVLGQPSAPALKITSPIGTVQFLGFAPALQTGIYVVPPVGAIEFLGAAPTVVTPIRLVPDSGTLLLLGFPPTRSSGVQGGVLGGFGFWLSRAGAQQAVGSVNLTPESGTIQFSSQPPILSGLIPAANRWGDISRGWFGFRSWGPHPETTAGPSTPAPTTDTRTPPTGQLRLLGANPFPNLVTGASVSGPIHWMAELGDWTETKRWGPFSGGNDQIIIPLSGTLRIVSDPPTRVVQVQDLILVPPDGAIRFGGFPPTATPVVGARRVGISWIQLETPNADRRAFVSWVELEVPAARRVEISWAQLEVPDEARSVDLSWVELELPTPEDVARRVFISWVQLQLPTRPVLDRLSEGASDSSVRTWMTGDVTTAPTPVTQKLTSETTSSTTIAPDLSQESLAGEADTDPDIV